MKNFYTLFIHELKNIYTVEERIIEALPDVIRAAESAHLKEALQNHLKETKQQLKRLQEVGKELDVELSGQPCPMITALLKDAEKVASANYESEVTDAAIISTMQKVEHFEISCYGALKAYANHFKLSKIHHLLEESSKEEGRANKKLSELAEGSIFKTGINKIAYKKCA